MMIDPAMIVAHWGSILVLTVAVIVGKVVFVTIGAFLAGSGTRTSVQSGMSLAQIGEFSFIIAGVGLASGATRSFLYPVAVAVSAITTLTTPWLIRASGPFAAYVDRKLPKRLQTLAALYGSWLERVRTSPSEPAERSDVRRHVRVMMIDAALLAAIIIGVSVEIEPLTEILTHSFAFSVAGARAATFAFAALVALPLLIGMVRSARLLGAALAARALPAAGDGTIDMGAAPRRVLVVMLQLGIVCIVGVPLVAITQPFVPLYEGTAVFAVILLVLGFVFWQRVTNLHGHARAGAEVIVAALAQQLGKDEEAPEASDEPEALTRVQGMLPGMGDPVRVRIAPDSPAVDRTLSQLNLRGLTGATVLAITRGAERVVLPIGAEVLHAGDVLALAGTQEAVLAATVLLRRGAAHA
jgi:CPA2 family monovalent cation:H+ antiporter-2